MSMRWLKVAVGFVLYVCLGTVYSWSVFRTPLSDSLGIDLAATSRPYAVFLAIFAFSMPLGGWLFGKLGPRRTLWLGALLVAGGWASASFAGSITALVLSYGLLGGLGVGLCYGVPLSVVAAWFPDRRGLALGITLAGFGVSPFVTAPIAARSIATLGLATSFWVLGLSFAIVLSLCAFFLGLPTGHKPGASPAPEATAMGPRSMIRTRAFWGLWVSFALGTFAGLTAIGMSASYGESVVGLSSRAAATAVAVFGICNGLGRPLYGWIIDSRSFRFSGALAFGCIAIGSGVLLLPIRPELSFALGFGVLWLMLGGWLAIAPAATVRLFGFTEYPANYGIVYTAYGVGALLGDASTTAIIARTGSIAASPWAILASGILGILVIATVVRPQEGQ